MVGTEIYQHPVGQEELPTSSCFRAGLIQVFVRVLMLFGTVNGDVQRDSHCAI